MFVPKYRRRANYGTLRRQFGEILSELRQRQGVEVVEDHAMPDHIHLCLSIPPRYSMPREWISEREVGDHDSHGVPRTDKKNSPARTSGGEGTASAPSVPTSRWPFSPSYKVPARIHITAITCGPVVASSILKVSRVRLRQDWHMLGGIGWWRHLGADSRRNLEPRQSESELHPCRFGVIQDGAQPVARCMLTTYADMRQRKTKSIQRGPHAPLV